MVLFCLGGLVLVVNFYNCLSYMTFSITKLDAIMIEFHCNEFNSLRIKVQKSFVRGWK